MSSNYQEEERNKSGVEEEDTIAPLTSAAKDHADSSSLTTFDDVLVLLGEFGRHQRILYFLFSFPYVFTSMQLLGWVFVGVTQPHRCLKFRGKVRVSELNNLMIMTSCQVSEGGRGRRGRFRRLPCRRRLLGLPQRQQHEQRQRQLRPRLRLRPVHLRRHELGRLRVGPGVPGRLLAARRGGGRAHGRVPNRRGGHGGHGGQGGEEGRLRRLRRRAAGRRAGRRRRAKLPVLPAGKVSEKGKE